MLPATLPRTTAAPRPAPRRSALPSAAASASVPLSRRAALSAALLAVSTAGSPALAGRPEVLGGPTSVTAQLVPTSGSGVSGTVTIREAVNKRGRTFLQVSVDISGLSPGKHGLNIHELGDVSCADGLCTGPSYNPDGLPHGAPDAIKKYGASASHYPGEGSQYRRHVGDLGNVTADASGRAVAEFEEPVVRLAGEKSVVGRSVVVHTLADDYVTEPVAVLAYGTLK